MTVHTIDEMIAGIDNEPIRKIMGVLYDAMRLDLQKTEDAIIMALPGHIEEDAKDFMRNSIRVESMKLMLQEIQNHVNDAVDKNSQT